MRLVSIKFCYFFLTFCIAYLQFKSFLLYVFDLLTTGLQVAIFIIFAGLDEWVAKIYSHFNSLWTDFCKDIHDEKEVRLSTDSTPQGNAKVKTQYIFLTCIILQGAPSKRGSIPFICTRFLPTGCQALFRR